MIFHVKILYIYKFLSQCLPIYAFYTILFMRRGLSVTDIAILIALWSVFTIIFEIPSGILSDRWNRRNMLVLSLFLQGLCFVIWFFSYSFIMFAIGFVFWSIGLAFVSGTEEGLIYDNLKYDGVEDKFTQIYGRAQFYANAGSFIGIASAGIIINFISIESMVFISASLCFFNMILVLQIREINFYSNQLNQTHIHFIQTLKDAMIFVKNSQTVLISILFLIFFVCLGSYLDEFDALIIHDFNLNEIWVSIILAIRFIFVALGDIFAPLFQKRITSINKMMLLHALACTCLLVFTIIWNQYAIFIFGISFMLMAIVEILFVDMIQNEIKEEARATVMSFYSAGQNIVMICLSLMYGWLAGILPLQIVYIMIAGYGIIGTLVFYLFLKIIK